jgi:rubrerythrin
VILKIAPSGVVRSLEQLFAIAHAMEHEAATRYAEFAIQVRASGMRDLADLFERLAEEERAHETSVVRWSQQRSGKPPNAAEIAWEPPETIDEEALGELATSRLASAYRVLSIAVRNEERAFAFWSYVAAEAESPDVQQAAEQMAREELEHVSLLRRARRQAYHAERQVSSRKRPESRAEILAQAAGLERALAQQLDGLAARRTGEDQSRLRDLAAQSRKMIEELSRLSHDAEPELVEATDMVAAAERLVELYLDIADQAREEAIVDSAQSLAARAIARLAWLRSLA